MNYKAVVFDLDGTLLDTLDDLTDSMNAVLASRHLPLHPSGAYRVFVGDGVENLVRRALPQENPDQAIVAECVQEMRQEYSRRWDRKTHPYEGVGEMLSLLVERGVRLSVLSNKPHDFTCLCVQRFLGDFDFDIVQGVDENYPPKPDPRGALQLAEKLGILPADFLYLGDTNTDMKTALAAGMYAVGAGWGFRSHEELHQSGAQSIIDNPTQMLDLLEVVS